MCDGECNVRLVDAAARVAIEGAGRRRDTDIVSAKFFQKSLVGWWAPESFEGTHYHQTRAILRTEVARIYAEKDNPVYLWDMHNSQGDGGNMISKLKKQVQQG